MVTRKFLRVVIAAVLLVAVAALSLITINWYRAGRVDVIKAAQVGDIDAIRFVLKWHPKQALHHRMTTPLWQASLHGHVEIVRLLVEHGANPNDRAANSGFSALAMAQVMGHDGIVHYLVDHGATNK